MSTLSSPEFETAVMPAEEAPKIHLMPAQTPAAAPATDHDLSRYRFDGLVKFGPR